jgi:hypothetical protein
MGKCNRCGAKVGRGGGDETVGAGIEVDVTWAAFEDGDYNQQFGNPLFNAEIPRSKHFCAPCLDLLGDSIRGAFDEWRAGRKVLPRRRRVGALAANGRVAAIRRSLPSGAE